MIFNQAQLFFIFAINGIIIGIIFDFFRIIRITFKTSDIITYFEDFIFWIFTAVSILYCLFTFNNGEIRLYMLFAILLGIIIYMLLFSSYLIKINVFIINKLKHILYKTALIISVPFRLVYKVLRPMLIKPTSFIIINIRKATANFYQKSIKKLKKKKKKEGFREVM